jgi:hypothetical protein
MMRRRNDLILPVLAGLLYRHRRYTGQGFFPVSRYNSSRVLRRKAVSF